MLANFQRILLGVILFGAVPSVGEAQEAPVSLFGIAIGSELKANKDYLFVQEGADTLYYSRRRTSNPEFLLQGVSITPSSHLVVKIDGRTATGPINVCQRMLNETRTQLKSRYPQLKERIDDVNGTDFHLLSMRTCRNEITWIEGRAPQEERSHVRCGHWHSSNGTQAIRQVARRRCATL